MSDLSELVAAELAEPVDPKVAAMAAAIAAQYGEARKAVVASESTDEFVEVNEAAA